MKIIIGYPPLEGKGSPMLGQNRQFQWYHVPAYIFPVVPASAASLLQENDFEAIWCDGIAQQWSYDQFLEFFDAEQPDLVAFETKTPVVKQMWRIIDELKQRLPTCKTVLMGDHITALPGETMQNSQVDYALTGGDYDFLLLGLARHIRDGEELPPGFWYRDGDQIKTSGPFPLKQDLNSLPFIDRKLTKADLYFEKWLKRRPFYYTMAGRDCHWGKCTFCSWTTTWPRFSVRTPDNMLDEIGFMIEQYGVREIFDDTGTFPAGGWLKNFCNGMVEHGYSEEILFSINMRYGYLSAEDALMMKKAGFRKMKMGLESASQETLDRLDKGVHIEQIKEETRYLAEAGLDIHLTIMVGYPWETRDDAMRTLDFANDLMASGYVEMLQSTVVVPYPGTPLYHQAVENDWLLVDPQDYDAFDMSRPICRTPDMTTDEIAEICAGIYKTFWNPRYIFNRLKRVRSLEDLDYAQRGVKSVIGHIRDFMRREPNNQPTN